MFHILCFLSPNDYLQLAAITLDIIGLNTHYFGFRVLSTEEFSKKSVSWNSAPSVSWEIRLGEHFI